MSRRTLSRITFLVGSVLALSSLPVAAQQGWRSVRLGEGISGTLSEQDPSFGSRGPFHVYRLEARRGDRFYITMRSGSLDAYLWVARSANGLSELVAEDDDSGGGTDSRLMFRAPQAGTYAVVAQALGAEETGDYELRVEVAPPLAAAVPVALALGAVREGTVDDTSPILDDMNPPVPYQLYTFFGKGERVRVALRSGAFDAFLRVTRMVGTTEEEVGVDDDGAGGTDAQLTFTANGNYRIYARPLDAQRTGTFAISLSEIPVARIVARQITIGQTLSGTITAEDPETDAGQYFHQYTLNGQPGQRLRIVLRSSSFDAMLSYGRAAGGSLEDASTDDDGAGGTDSQLDITVPRDGQYVIRVHALGSQQVGTYSLSVTRQQ